MEDSLHLQLGLNQESKKEETNGFTVVDTESDVGIRPYVPFRERLLKVLHSHKFHVVVISLVIFDCLLVITELMIDLKIHVVEEDLQKNESIHPTISPKVESHDTAHASHVASHVLHYLSISVLSLFIIEIMFKLYAYRLEFFKHKLEVFDAVVVFLSFSLDVAFRDNNTAVNGTGLIIILRLWRVARVLNGIVLSVKTQSEEKLTKVRKMKDALEQELCQSREYISSLEMEVEHLKKLLETHGIKPTSSPNSKKSVTSSPNVIRVTAEVNEVPTVVA